MSHYSIVPDLSKLKEYRFEKFKPIAVSLPETLALKIDAKAANEFLTRSGWVRKIILAHLAVEESNG